VLILTKLQKQRHKIRKIGSKYIMLTLTRRFKHRLLLRQLQRMSPFQEMIIGHIKKTTALKSAPRHY